MYGLTATPKRKNNDQKLIFVYIGNLLHQVNQKEYLDEKNIRTEINIKETELFAPFDYKIDKYETISRILVHNTQRNSIIIRDIEENADRFKTILILSERKSHVDILNLYLKDKFETITNSNYQKLCEVSERTALRDLDELSAKGILEKKGEKKGTYYEL